MTVDDPVCRLREDLLYWTKAVAQANDALCVFALGSKWEITSPSVQCTEHGIDIRGVGAVLLLWRGMHGGEQPTGWKTPNTEPTRSGSKSKNKNMLS